MRSSSAHVRKFSPPSSHLRAKLPSGRRLITLAGKKTSLSSSSSPSTLVMPRHSANTGMPTLTSDGHAGR